MVTTDGDGIDLEPHCFGLGADGHPLLLGYAVVFQSLVKIVAKEFVGSARSLIDNLALTRRDAFINNFAAARQRIRDEHAGGACSTDGTAATQRGRWPQFSVMKSSNKSAVLLGSIGTGFNVGRRQLNGRPFSDNVGRVRRDGTVGRCGHRRRRGA